MEIFLSIFTGSGERPTGMGREPGVIARGIAGDFFLSFFFLAEKTFSY